MGEITDIATALRGGITAPALLSPVHDTTAFNCGHEALDDYLRLRARKSSDGNLGKTFVVCHGVTVIGYYTLAMGAEKRAAVPKKMQKNSPDHIPLLLLARLAVDDRFKRKGVGRALLKDALLRAVQVSQIVGVRAVIVHAIDEEARSFYQKYEFIEFPAESRTMFLPIKSIKEA